MFHPRWPRKVHLKKCTSNFPDRLKRAFAATFQSKATTMSRSRAGTREEIRSVITYQVRLAKEMLATPRADQMTTKAFLKKKEDKSQSSLKDKVGITITRSSWSP